MSTKRTVADSVLLSANTRFTLACELYWVIDSKQPYWLNISHVQWLVVWLSTPEQAWCRERFSPSGLAVILHLTIWLVKSNVENAAATSLIGLLYGPIFPACLSMANDVLPAEVHMVAMALMWAILNNASHYHIDPEYSSTALHLQVLVEVSEFISRIWDSRAQYMLIWF